MTWKTTSLVFSAALLVSCNSFEPEIIRDWHQSKNGIRYAHDGDIDYWQSALETAARGRGDCEDQAAYLHALLCGSGYESEVVCGWIGPGKTGPHCWLELWWHGEWWILDPAAGVARPKSFYSTRYIENGFRAQKCRPVGNPKNIK